MSDTQLPDIEALKAQGVDHFDPIRFRYIESMASEAVVQRESVRAMIASKVQEALAAYQADYAAAELATTKKGDLPATSAVANASENSASTAALRALTERLNRRHASDEVEAGKAPSLEEALREQDTLLLTTDRPGNHEPAQTALPTAPAIGELKSSTSFRALQGRINAEKTAAQALADESEDAGPLNAHRLVIRSLSAMQELSPQYLNRFVAYIDTLLWLEHSSSQNLPESNKSTPGKARAKAKKSSEKR